MNTEKAIKEKFYSFSKEMNEWEVETKKKYDEIGMTNYAQVAGENLKVIYKKYLTNKDRKLGRQSVPNAGFPPEYDPQQETIQNISIDGNKAIIETKWVHPANQNFAVIYRYTMKLQNGEWLLDTKKKYSKGADKWSNIVF
ncbi:NTF2 fold immunity protein [Gilliamella sp. wkB112]|uniref:NTF2 fold immunity protein n=1 Tax=Gilliamella sp. wkB112 TaxID=3120257 RepID=UPI00080DB0D4|nr:NTF2 fold immunity protein [Gilliamella apicola]OCG00762.1 hypothetical protein A9G12_03085 [Gilliamella apicola]